jgi:group I intron endonuclease
MTAGIYHIKNNISGGVYYGRSVDVEDRLTHHRNELKRNVHRNKRLQRSWNKYGKEAFTFELIWEEEPEKLYELEGFILEFMWGDKRLYNHHKLSYGGFEPGNKLGCFARSEETKKKMSKAFTGRVFSEEHRNNIRKTKLNKKASLETKQKMSLKRTGVKRPDSWHKAMAEYRSKNPNPMFGKPSPMRGKHFPKIKCEHCEIEASKGNYNRWHGINCKKLKIKE